MVKQETSKNCTQTSKTTDNQLDGCTNLLQNFQLSYAHSAPIFSFISTQLSLKNPNSVFDAEIQFHIKTQIMNFHRDLKNSKEFGSRQAGMAHCVKAHEITQL